MAGKLEPTDIWVIMEELFYQSGIRCLRHETRQTFGDSKTPGVVVIFSAKKEEYYMLRKAANLAGLWFSNAEWENLHTYSIYKVFVVQDKKTLG